MFSKACEYGIRAMIFIASESRNGNRVSLRDITQAINSPEAFTAKILQQLSKEGLIDSTKGPYGGFEMSPHQLESVMLSDVVTTIDSDMIYTGCGLGLSECSEDHPCPLHNDFKAIREQLRDMLETTRIGEMAELIVEGEASLKE